ncbi:MAG: response regulator, partial [Oscillochloris sp.]|nr:response regulator [Oscillochloris sp.]
YLLATLADYAAIAIENARLYEQVKLSERRYKDLFANAYDLIFMLDRDLRITSINKAGAQITGYSVQALIGQPLWTLCAPEAWGGAQEQLRSLLDGQSVPPFELELVNQNQDPIYLEISAHVMQNGGGKPAGLHCIARNLTDRRRLEQQLVQSEKLSAIGQLVAGVAHELNNPLTSVSGYAQLILRSSDLSDDTRQDIEQIHAQAERAARIVQNLLIFAREHTPERSQVAINDVLRSALALQAYQLRVDNIAIQLDLDPNLVMTIADPHQLQQVFLNLITNARHAMVERGGPGTLTLRTRVMPPRPEDEIDVPMIRVEVADTGIGIPERNLRKIFNPFFTTKPVGQGTGLGLSICFGIVKEHEGQIWAESQVGVGTHVYVALPVRQISNELVESVVAPTSPIQEPEQSLSILVVDDEEPVIRLISRLLHDLGHQPTVTLSGAEALNILSRQSFDIILTDVRMPGMSGFELLSIIRARDTDLADRVIFITGDTLSPTTREHLEQSGSLCLPKPFSINQLEAVIQQVLKRRSLSSNNR